MKATKLGAYDFLEKPLSLDRTLIVLKNAVEARRLRTENLEFKRQFSVGSVLTGDSVPLKALRQQIRLMAPTNGRVLIYGESGTGKELIARSIHAESLRRDRVFVELNCAAIPRRILRRSFLDTGTVRSREALLEQRGTLRSTPMADALSGRSRRHEPKDTGQGVVCPGRPVVHAGGRRAAAARGCTADGIDQQRLGRGDCQGQFSQDLFYPLNVVPFFATAFARTQTGYSALARSFLPTSAASTATAHGYL